MSFDSNRLEKIIEITLEKAKSTVSLVDYLIQKELFSHAANRIYIAMHYMIQAAAAKNGIKLSTPESLSDWFQNKLIKEKKVLSFKYNMIVSNAFRDAKAADFDLNTNFSKSQILKKQEEMKELIGELEKYLRASTKKYSLEETMQILKKTVSLANNSFGNPKTKDIASKILRFISFKVFLTNQKGRQAFEEYRKNPNNPKLEMQFEIRLEDSLEDNTHIRSELNALLFEIEDLLGLPSKQKPKTIIKKPLSKTPKSPLSNATSEEKHETPEIKDETLLSEDIPEENDFEEMDLKSNVILSLWDFSELAEYALEHALLFSHASGAEVQLLHIVKHEKDIEGATKKLEIVTDLAYKKYNKKVKILVKEGNIFTDISKISDELKADMVILGSYGIKGMQKLTGSWALKVIRATKAPFLVIQAPPKRKNIEKVVFPVDHKRGTKKILNQVKYLTKFFKIKFSVCKPGSFVTDLQKKKAISNYVFINSYLKQNRKLYDVNNVGESRNFTEKVIKFAKDADADLIFVITSSGFDTQTIDEQKLIVNKEKIPVMCINPISAMGWTYNTQAAN